MTDIETTLVRVVLLYILFAGGLGYLFGGPNSVKRVMASSEKTHTQIAAALGFVRAVRIATATSLVMLVWCCVLVNYWAR